jgi:hypothetical protein
MTLKGRPLVIGWPIGRSNQAGCLNFDWKIGPHSIPISSNKFVPAAPHYTCSWGGGRVWSGNKMTENGEPAKLLLLSEKLKDLTISAA